MGKKERQAMRMLGIKEKKSDGPAVEFKLAQDWYLTTWFEKLIFILGGLSLFYSIARIIFQGVW